MPIEVRPDLIKRIQNGDKEAFGEVVDLTGQFIYGIAFKTLGDQEEARDVAQESYLKVWKRIHSYKSEFVFTTWLYRIVMNTSLDRLRKIKRERKIFREYDDSVQFVTTPEITSKGFEEKQLHEFIQVATWKLSEKQHAVFVLHDLEDFSQDEVSEILRMPKNRVKSNLYYARKAIRQILVLSEEKIISKDEM